MFNKEFIGENYDYTLQLFRIELDKQFNDLIIKNNKYAADQNILTLDKYKLKIKGMIINGDIKNIN